MKRLFFSLLLTLALAFGGLRAQTRGNFPYVAVPSYIATEDAVAEWLALHWWDAYDFSAAEVKYHAGANRRGFVEFINTLYATTPTLSERAIGEMMRKAAVSEEGYWYFLEMAEEVLYDPSSPMRNDLIWEWFVRHAVGSGSPLDEFSRERYIFLLEIVSRNQQGTVATDFVYTLADGSQGRLHNIRAPFTLIWFYNPGCSECARTKAQIDATGYLTTLHERGLIEVLALHPDGDLTEWRRRLPENPSWWISAYDKGERIHKSNLYDLKAIPTIYLLDAQKRVIMKDPTVEDLIGVLGSLANGR